jgi:RNA polymerase sigma-70 factor (ECF subfamily)
MSENWRQAASAAMDRYACGDDAAFSELYDLLAPRLTAFLARRTRDDALASDLVQQTFLQMHASRRHFTEGADVMPWAFAIARRLMIDVFRKSGREIVADDDWNDDRESAAPDPPPDRIVARRRLAVRISQELQRVPELQRAAFELVKRDGLSIAEAAEVLGTTHARPSATSCAKSSKARGERGRRRPRIEEVPVNSIDPASASLALKARVMAAAAATPSPTRRQGRRVTRLVLGASIAAGLACFELVGGVAHAPDRPLLYTVRLADGWALASAGLTWLLARFGTPFVRSPVMLQSACAVAPFALLTWMARFHGAYLDPPGASAWSCLAASLLCAAIPLAGFVWARRGSEARHPATLGAAIGAASGAWAGLLGLLRCPDTGRMHALLGHALPLAVATVVGALAGARLLGIAGYRRRGRRSPRIRAPRDAPSAASTTMGRM